MAALTITAVNGTTPLSTNGVHSNANNTNGDTKDHLSIGINPHSTHSITTSTPAKPTLVIVEGRYQNWIKPVILLTSLNIAWDPIVLNGLPHMKTEWYRKIHPQRMVPALIDNCNDERMVLWDSTSILLYLCQRYDTEKRWCGRDWIEEAEIMNWLIFQTASFGPTSKYWVHFDLRPIDQKLPAAQAKLHDDLKAQYTILDARLSEPGQKWLGLKDRPTIADIANYPFTDKPTSERMGLDLAQWPALKEWSQRMSRVGDVAKTYMEMDTRKAIELEDDC